VSSLEGAEAIVVRPSGYEPDWMERTGRKLKMEYLGMGSVFAVIFQAAFGQLPRGAQSAIATAGSFFLFMGLKKKTRDHIACSFLLFIAAALAGPGVTNHLWFLPYALFGACVWAMEGYLEKRGNRMYAVPLLLATFAAVSPLWILGLGFVSAYLLQPRPELPGFRKRLAGIVAISTALSIPVAGYVAWRGGGPPVALDGPGRRLFALYASIALISLACLLCYWGRLARPHRVNAMLFGVLAVFDAHVVALFGMVSMVLLSATIFRNGIDSDRLRPLTRRAEWYFFPAILAVAVWTLVAEIPVLP
jgi:hypothetical protein